MPGNPTGQVLLLLERTTQDTQGLVIDRAQLREAPDRLEGSLNAKQDDLVRSCGEAALLVWRVLRSSDYPGKDEMSQPLRLRYTLADQALAPQGASADLAFTVMLLMDRLSAGHRADEPQSLVAATGELFGTAKQLQDGYRNPLLEVRAVGGVPAKVQAALDYFEQHGQAQTGRILVPQGNLAELEKAGLGDKVRQGVIVPVRQLQDVLDALKQLPVLSPRKRQMLAGLRAPFQGNPFRGLEAFDIEHRAQYFGREEQIQEVLAHLPADPATQQLPGVLIYGYSGSGKSSLLRAGVLGTVLYAGAGQTLFLPRPHQLSSDAEHPVSPVWRAPSLADPTEDAWAASLAQHWQALLGGDPLPSNSLQALGNELSVRLLEDQRAGRHWVLAIDQMEELVSQVGSAGEERAQIDQLLQRLQQLLQQLQRVGVWVLATLREEYVGRLKPALQAVFTEDVVLKTPDEEQQRRFVFEVIERPCQLAGIEREPQLLDALRADAKDATSIPLLQFALDALYQRAQKRAEHNKAPIKLLLADYEAQDFGRIHGAVNAKASEILSRSPETASQVLGLLARMARKATSNGRQGNDYVRAPLLLSEAEQSLIEPWVQERLVVRSGQHGEVAHEALLNHFIDLREWMERNEDLLQWRHAYLLPHLTSWKANGQVKVWLLQHVHLEKMRHALSQPALFSASEIDYLQLSLQLREQGSFWIPALGRVAGVALSAGLLYLLGGGDRWLSESWGDQSHFNRHLPLSLFLWLFVPALGGWLGGREAIRRRRASS
ncbi:ATP-binding protein [Paucibacter sp. DJ2R-2]|uniref:ATP-binding protein n=1 Tax=Paucibacter sp. DJ2R-2 TaxID=2893558 RepID=UPI0021E4B719|nr:AAA family ATPase [Paucibacter sp. DJ2R-2]MCV2441278.1 AAA family ATPase [Paucibacter sp. DJ2R-2]